MNASYLADTSAWARYRKPAVAKRFDDLLGSALVAACAVTQVEALRVALNRTEVEAVLGAQAGLRWLATPDGVWDRVIDVQAELSATGRRTAVKVPDLIVAAVAERHRVIVLHYDRDFDTIAGITGQPTEWVVPAGSAD